MKSILFFLLFVSISAKSQKLKIALNKDSSELNNVYLLKIFNNQNNTIGIKCSAFFTVFSEDTILKVAVSNWQLDEKKPKYGIHCSEEDSKYSDISGYQLLVLPPELYLTVKVELVDFDKFKEANFRILYTDITNDKELLLYMKRVPGKALISNNPIQFKYQDVIIE